VRIERNGRTKPHYECQRRPCSYEFYPHCSLPNPARQPPLGLQVPALRLSDANRGRQDCFGTGPLQNSEFRLIRSLVHAPDVVFPHPGLQGRALEAESRSGSSGASDVPVGFLQRIQNA
jgi:hypothetical protein